MPPTKRSSTTARPSHLRLVTPLAMNEDAERPWSAKVRGWRDAIPGHLLERTRVAFGRASPVRIVTPSACDGGSRHDAAEPPPPCPGARRDASAHPPHDDLPGGAERAKLARAAFIDGLAMLEHTLHSAWRAVTVATRVCSQLGRDAIRAEWEARASRS